MIEVKTCPAWSGPVWKSGGETCSCILSEGHLDTNPFHECDCGAWWSDSCRRSGGGA